MVKRTFNYCATHKGDEAYMQKMCEKGWAAIRLVEGVWTFEPCRPNQYCYRICYLRGMKNRDIQERIRQYAAEGISFVSRYSFWAIFRSPKPFVLYSPEEEREICRSIYAPMPAGAVISWLLVLAGLFLAYRFHLCFLIPTLLIGIYGAVCTRLAFAYHRLLKTLP